MAKLARELAATIQAIRNCEQSGNTEWAEKHALKLGVLMGNMPSGSGFDAGTQIELDECEHDKLVFTTAFHHMDPNGYYDGWTNHKVIVRPSFIYSYDMRVTGKDRNDIKNYIMDVFHTALERAQ